MKNQARQDDALQELFACFDPLHHNILKFDSVVPNTLQIEPGQPRPLQGYAFNGLGSAMRSQTQIYRQRFRRTLFTRMQRSQRCFDQNWRGIRSALFSIDSKHSKTEGHDRFKKSLQAIQGTGGYLRNKRKPATILPSQSMFKNISCPELQQSLRCLNLFEYSKNIPNKRCTVQTKKNCCMTNTPDRRQRNVLSNLNSITLHISRFRIVENEDSQN